MDHDSRPPAAPRATLYQVKKTIVGQDGLLERMLVALLARGHLLVEGVPGLAKTMAVKTLAQAIGGEFQRIQFTPDLVPADVVGTRIYNQRDGRVPGLARAGLRQPPARRRDQPRAGEGAERAARGHAGAAGDDRARDLSRRRTRSSSWRRRTRSSRRAPTRCRRPSSTGSCSRCSSATPRPTQEFVVVERMTTAHEPPEPVIDAETLLEYQRAADAVYVDPQIIEYAVRLATATRDLGRRRAARPGPVRDVRRQPAGVDQHGARRQGAGVPARPRLRAARATSRELARDVLRHRIVLSYEALADDVSPDDLLGPLLAAIPLPELDHAGATSAARRHARGACGAGRRRQPAALTPERVLRRLEWRVLRRLDGRLQGDYRTVFRGTGVDVADLREYQFGDDLRHIDWNVTARTDVAHVREYLEDREVTAWLLLDRSASMDFGPVERHKHVVLTEVAATVAQLLSRGGNRVGALLFDTGVRRDDPARVGPQPGAADPLPAAAARRRRQPGTDRPRRRAARRARDPAAPVARRDRLGLHDRAGLAGAAGPARAPARRGGDPGGRPARVRAARRRDDLRRGRRDRRGDLRRHRRPRVPAAAGAPRPTSGRRPSSPTCARPGSTCTRSPRTTTSCAPCSASPTCAGRARSGGRRW